MSDEPKSAFSNDGAEAIERTVEAAAEEALLGEEDMEAFFELERVTAALAQHPGSKVALQFPDELLPYSIKVEEELRSRLDKDFFLLADTTFGRCVSARRNNGCRARSAVGCPPPPPPHPPHLN